MPNRVLAFSDEKLANEGVAVSDRIGAVIAELERDPSPELLARLEHLLNRTQIAVEEEDNPNFRDKEPVEPLLREVNAILPFETDRAYFKSLYGWTDTKTLARVWAIELPMPIGDLSRDEIHQLLEATNQHIATDDKLDRFIWLLEASLPNAFSTNLLFWPHAEWDSSSLAAEIVTRRTLFETGGEAAVREHEVATARTTLAKGTADYATLRQASALLPTDERVRYETMIEEAGVRQVEAARAKQTKQQNQQD